MAFAGKPGRAMLRNDKPSSLSALARSLAASGAGRVPPQRPVAARLRVLAPFSWGR